MAPGARARRGPGSLFDRPAARPVGAGELIGSRGSRATRSSLRLGAGAAHVDDGLRVVRITPNRQDAVARAARGRREPYGHFAFALGSEGCAAAVHDREITVGYDTGERDRRGPTAVLNRDLAGLADVALSDLAQLEIARRDFQPDRNGRSGRSGGGSRRLSCSCRISRCLSCRRRGGCCWSVSGRSRVGGSRGRGRRLSGGRRISRSCGRGVSCRGGIGRGRSCSVSRRRRGCGS